MAVSERTSVVQVIGLHHAGLPCNDLDRAVDFYTRVLGFEHLRSNKIPDDRGHFLGNATPPEVQVDLADHDFEVFGDLRELLLSGRRLQLRQRRLGLRGELADQLGGPACQRACPHDALVRMDMRDQAALAEWINR